MFETGGGYVDLDVDIDVAVAIVGAGARTKGTAQEAPPKSSEYNRHARGSQGLKVARSVACLKEFL
jgi:hypothetical protein